MLLAQAPEVMARLELAGRPKAVGFSHQRDGLTDEAQWLVQTDGGYRVIQTACSKSVPEGYRWSAGNVATASRAIAPGFDQDQSVTGSTHSWDFSILPPADVNPAIS